MKFEIVAEEPVADTGTWDNGAEPMWCWGSSTIVRDGDTVFASVNIADPDLSPLCNTRWHLFGRKDGGGWALLNSSRAGEREPCPLARLQEGAIALSTNPAISQTGERDDGATMHRCDPKLLKFDSQYGSAKPRSEKPMWDQEYEFSEHSYRGLAADGVDGGLFITQQVRDDRGYHPQSYNHAWAYRSANGVWLSGGVLRFPMRGCYPTFSVSGSAVHALAISDETEPNPEWKAFKREATGREWDYDFRQLFYAFTPDIKSVGFSPPLTIASADETGGIIHHSDMWIDQEGDAHILYIERNVNSPALRGRFFQDMAATVELKYVRICRGRPAARRTLIKATELQPILNPSELGDFDGPRPTWAKFHPLVDGRVLLLWNQTGDGDDSELYVRQFFPEGAASTEEAVRIPLKHPLPRFFTASQSAGCLPLSTIDLLSLKGQILRYAQIEVQ